MEEQVGQLWHRLITRLADKRHLHAAVHLNDIKSVLSVYFRALGGDPGLQIELADATAHNARRGWLQRIAGANDKVELAWKDERSLRLPGLIAWFDTPSLNRDLYYWLAALAVADDESVPGYWFARNQALVLQTLERFPGLQSRYASLVEAHLAQRPDTGQLKPQAAAAEAAFRQALLEPGSIDDFPPCPQGFAPIPLWLHPNPPTPHGKSRSDNPDEQEPGSGKAHTPEEMARRRAEEANKPKEDRGLVTIRMENIFSWGEFVNVDRGTEDEEDAERAEDVARDLDQLAVVRDKKASAIRLKFDLDLPPESADDLVLHEGILLPEWDWKKQALLPRHCRIIPMMSREAPPAALPPRLARTAKRLRNQFQALAPARTWHRGQADGPEIDLDAYLRFAADRAAGQSNNGDALYRELRSGARDLACLLMADLSLSTDSWINDRYRVIDVIRDSLYLFGESLAATGDRFGLYGFSSRKQDPVRVHTIKLFDEPYNAGIRGRIEAIKPGYYTRMGAAIRYGTELLAAQPGGRRLLLLLTDGKPNDLDQYEGRYGIEDTRHAIKAAHRLGLQPFCVTIDEKGNDYLPHLFGSNGYVVIHNPIELPKRLPMLYAQLTA